jgi:penicillin G amidase
MKIIRQIWFLAILFIFSSVVFGQVSATQLKIDGLKQEVTVRRDYRGIPYIEAKNDDDLYFAQGFITAQDRLWQMNLLRRVARGESAEIFGNRTLEEDKRWRRYGFAKIAADSLPILSPQLKSALENYARGVNAYVATLDDKTMPPEFKILQFKPSVWTAADTIIVGKILADGLSSTWRNDLLRAAMQKSLSPEKYADATRIVTPYDVVLFGKDTSSIQNPKSKIQNRIEVSERDLQMAENEAQIRQSSLERVGLYAEELAASNNWVISGKRTADGKPLLANDPHLQSTTPNIWHLVHLSTPTMRVSGVVLPGSPGVILGHNEFIAWGATNVGPDVQDLYAETFNAEGKYKTPKGWETPKIRKEEIKVRKGLTSTETETVTIEVVETRHGPIYSEEGGNKYALKWTAFDPKNQEFEAFFLLNRAKNWTDFQNALKTYGGSTQNFIYADVKGNIGWIAGGRIPIRKTGEGAIPYDGSTDDGEWIGYIPFAELPQLYNPPGNFIVTANQRIIGQSYKYQQVARDVAAPWRARRIYDLINANPKMSVEATTAILRDVQSLPHKMLADEIIKLQAASPETLAVLKSWDGKMSADSRGALLINQIRNTIGDKIAEENKPLPGFVVRERLLHFILAEKPQRWLPKGFNNYIEFFKASDKTARENLQKQFGNDESKWVWGAVFKANFPHPLAAAPLIGGQFATPNIGIDGSGTTPNVGSAVSMRHIALPNDWDNTRQVIPMGQSGIPSSPHYKDQFDSWNKGDLPIFPFSKSAVEKAAKETWVLQPK